MACSQFPDYARREKWKRRSFGLLPNCQLENRGSEMQEIRIGKAQTLPQHIAVTALGWTLILGGIFGLFLPVLPGGALILAGALILGPRSALLRRVVEKCRARFPFLERVSRRFVA